MSDEETKEIINPAIKYYVEKQIKESRKSSVDWTKIGLTLLPILISGFVWLQTLDKEVMLIKSSQSENREIKNTLTAIQQEVMLLKSRQSEITEIKNTVKDIQQEVISLRITISRITGETNR